MTIAEPEIAAALVVVGLSAERAAKEVAFRDDMIRIARSSGASVSQLVGASGLTRATIRSIIRS